MAAHWADLYGALCLDCVRLARAYAETGYHRLRRFDYPGGIAGAAFAADRYRPRQHPHRILAFCGLGAVVGWGIRRYPGYPLAGTRDRLVTHLAHRYVAP